MKKILMLSVLALGVSAMPAMAEGDKHHGKHGGMFKKIDTDGNGEISRAEFDAKHDEMFKKMDKDGNGSISKDEMKAHHKGRKAKHAERKEKRESHGED